ncbi:MAG: N5-glutamine S-adenosyl-L-methionine-dependent methyltransferase [Methanocella sp. PtaU1.Bin125]|nr:MAG: N5-glutamine S-adenosyl-L-methionine-dependent methyltransferase [Methanocella sp. PtaU1.Bin125]
MFEYLNNQGIAGWVHIVVDYEVVKSRIKELVDKYNNVRSSGRLRNYNEENTKKDFITPLFRILGWDVENVMCPDEVTNEDKISRGRVDYSFRINSVPKFFLEAKALNKGLNEKEDAAQAINYSWHKGVVWAVLTDFNTLIVYNAEVNEKDPQYARFIELTYDKYIENFDQLWLLSKPGFLEGLLNKQAEKWNKKQKKTKVNEQLLNELMVYREKLSKNIKARNLDKLLDDEDIDEAVQRIIDRLIFIRTTEDREIEPQWLRGIIRQFRDKPDKKLIKAINTIFRAYDQTYNSKLFTYNPDNLEQRHLCENLEIDNDVILEVVEGLYDSKDGVTHFDFSAIDADVLGNIYEQYLSSILKTTDKRAKVETQEAHRHDQGIYYTPTFIVDYIVKNTVGATFNKKPAELEKLAVLDMACGSGSFLLKAFDYINNYFDTYDEATKHMLSNKEDDERRATRKNNILKNNLYGVDLDPKAVEIAQLNLLLKATETKHRLPDLRNNIKCGNALLSVPLQEMGVSDNPEAGRPFNWATEFSEIMGAGGFDVIIGNPPYVRQEELKEIKPYLEKNYESYHGQADLCVYFFERELKMLKEGGYFGMIVSSKWLKAGFGVNLRKFLNKYWIEELIDFGDLQLFKGATTYPCIIIIRNIKKQNPEVRVCNITTLNFENLTNYINQNQFTFDQKNLKDENWNFVNPNIVKIVSKVQEQTITLKEYVNNQFYNGIKTGLIDVFKISKEKRDELIEKDPNSAEILVPMITGNELKRYAIDYQGDYLILTKIGIDISKYPAVYEYLLGFKEQLSKRGDQGEMWYELRTCSYYDLFTKPKIMYAEMQVSPKFALDREGYFTHNVIFFLPVDDPHLLSILNSRIGWFFIQYYGTPIQNGYKASWKYLSKVPIPKTKDPELSSLAEKMMELNKKLITIKDKATDERTQLINQIKETDVNIDNRVYQLYGIDQEQRQVIEECIK